MRVRVLAIASVIALFSSPAFAQQQAASAPEDTVVMKKSDLTSEQLAKVQQQQVKEMLGAYREYAEMGRGVGLAVGESLKAVKDVAVDLSQTDVGKFTMFLIAWKVMARDVVGMGDMVFGYLVGIPLLFIGGIMLLWSYYKQCIPRRVLIKHTKDGGKEWQMFVPNEVELNVEGSKIQTRNIWAIGHVVVAILFLLFCSVMIFGC